MINNSERESSALENACWLVVPLVRVIVFSPNLARFGASLFTN